MSSFLKTIMLLVLLTVLMISCGFALGQQQGMMVALAAACLVNFGVYGFSGRVVLAMYRAQPLAEEEAPEIFEIMRALSVKAGIPTPRIYMLPSASANAFATGRDPKHAVIAVTHGLVGLLNKEELSGAFGHELAHIVNRDILIGSVVATLAGALGKAASMFRWSFSWGGEREERDGVHPLAWLIASILMPFAAMLIHLTISRTREYGADHHGARLCENPLYLASALHKIEAHSQRFPLREAEPATAHLFIVSPLSVKAWSKFFRIHPSVEERIARLEAMSCATETGNRNFESIDDARGKG